MSRILSAAALVALLLVVVIATAPARLLVLLLPAEQALLQGVSGTLWEGSAARGLLRLPGGYLHLGSVRWQLCPFSLLTLAPQVQVQSQWGTQRLSGQVTLYSEDTLDLAEVDATLPADLLRQFLPLELGGQLSLQASQLRLQKGQPVAADGRLVWQEAGWRAGPSLRPLGSYALQFQQPLGQALVGEVITLAGDVQAQGRVELSGRNYLVDLVLAGPGLGDQQLQQALQLVATPRDEDYHLLLQGEM